MNNHPIKPYLLMTNDPYQNYYNTDSDTIIHKDKLRPLKRLVYFTGRQLVWRPSTFRRWKLIGNKHIKKLRRQK